MSMFSSPWRVYFTFTLGASDISFFSVEQRLTRFVPNPQPRQALTLPVRPLNAVPEALPLLDPIYAHYVAQWPKVVPRSEEEEEEFGRGFFVEGSVVPEQIADPSRSDELDEIYVRNIPEEIRRTWSDEGSLGPYALKIDPELIRWHIYCVPAAELGIEPFPGVKP
jgi:hypothetical protein